ncbi:hypothetical protein MarSH_217 [Marseillevirus Shanghai 1]|nr:hypothetical protein MarSH_217 [Marseillevirus Shanghai 1]
MDYLEEEDFGYYGGEEKVTTEDIFAQYLKEVEEGREQETYEDIVGVQEQEQEFAYSFQQIVSSSSKSGGGSTAVFVGRRRIVSDEERFEKEVKEILEEEESIVKPGPRDKTKIAEKLEELLPESRFYNVRIFTRAYLFVQKNGKEFTPEQFRASLKAYKKTKKQMIAEDFLRYCLLVSDHM